MLINFETIEPQTLAHFKGGEKEIEARMVADAHNRIMLGRLKPGASIGVHTHDTSSEVIFVLAGAGKAVVGEAEERLTPGLCHYCPKGATHTLINDGDEDLVFYAVVPQQ